MTSSMGSYVFTDPDVKQYGCIIKLYMQMKNVEVIGSTILESNQKEYYLIPVDASSLTLENVTSLAEPKKHPDMEGVNYVAQATLTAFQESETCNVTKLPLDVMKATDNFGNTMYFIQNK